jgi:hypothetical protein
VGFLATYYTSIVPVFALTPGGRRTELRDAKGRKMMNTMAYAKANTGLFVIFRYGTYKTYPRLFSGTPLFLITKKLLLSLWFKRNKSRDDVERVNVRVWIAKYETGHCEGVYITL